MSKFINRSASDMDDTAHADCDDVCAGRAGGFPLRRDFGFTLVEDLTLDVLRCVCDVYSTGSAQGWDVAIRTAELELGPFDGPLLVARVTSFVRALRAERHGNFKYLGFGCSHICNDELAMLTLIKATRLKDRRIRADLIKSVVCGAGISEQTEQAVECLAALHRARVARSELATVAPHDMELSSPPSTRLH